MKKIRLVFEAEIQQDTELTPDVVQRIWGSYLNFSEMIQDEYWQENIRHSQVLLDALLANPEKYKETLLGALQSKIELTPNDFYRLAGQDLGGKRAVEFDPIEDLVETLPPATAAYFEETMNDGVFSERTELVTLSLDINFTSIRVEEVN